MTQILADLHFFLQTQISTLICDSKQLKKLASINSRIETVKNVIYFDNDGAASDSGTPGEMSNWTVSPFSEVEKLGKENPIQPRLPSKTDIAVVMYTSGSTGLPKVCSRFYFQCFLYSYSHIPGIYSNNNHF